MDPSAPPSHLDEEARVLEMYRQQHLQRQQQQQQQQPPSFEDIWSEPPSRAIQSANNNHMFAPAMDSSNSNSHMFASAAPPPPRVEREVYDDEAVARALQQQEDDARFARDVEAQMQREEQLQTAAATSDPDVQYALQVEQQLRDEELARQFAFAEEQALQAQQQAQQQQVVQETRGQKARRRICGCFVPLGIIGAGLAIWYVVAGQTGNPVDLPFTGGSGGGSGGGDGFIPWFQDSDPFDSLEPGEVAKWRNGRTQEGLELTILNALTESWDEVFAVVLKDWDEGKPDTLDLRVERAFPEEECETKMGKSKVCNGNYGDTQWKGINMVILQNGYIAGSSSKMNEYYLARASTAQRRYTLCHEMGHSFGLPHTDENFYNKDLGNCMDYTSNPEVNQSPDDTNYQFLKDLYGILPGYTTEAPTEVDQPSNRRLQEDAAEFPPHVQERLLELTEVHQHAPDQLQQQGWRQLHASQHGQAHELELGDGWVLQMHKLLHNN